MDTFKCLANASTICRGRLDSTASRMDSSHGAKITRHVGKRGSFAFVGVHQVAGVVDPCGCTATWASLHVCRAVKTGSVHSRSRYKFNSCSRILYLRKKPESFNYSCLWDSCGQAGMADQKWPRPMPWGTPAAINSRPARPAFSGLSRTCPRLKRHGFAV